MDNPCDTCLRWYECNGIDKENCPMWDNEHKEETNNETVHRNQDHSGGTCPAAG